MRARKVRLILSLTTLDMTLCARKVQSISRASPGEVGVACDGGVD